MLYILAALPPAIFAFSSSVQPTRISSRICRLLDVAPEPDLPHGIGAFQLALVLEPHRCRGTGASADYPAAVAVPPVTIFETLNVRQAVFELGIAPAGPKVQGFGYMVVRGYDFVISHDLAFFFRSSNRSGKDSVPVNNPGQYNRHRAQLK